MFTLPHYAKIKDNYCVAYYGNSKEYLTQLKLLRPIMEKQLPGIKVFIACRNDSIYLLKNEERILSKEELQTKKTDFAYIRELTCDMESHPIENFMKESNLPCGPIHTPVVDPIRHCVLLTNGILPTKTLSASQIQKAIQYIQNKGFNPEINGSIETAGWVVGVENEHLFNAAANGKRTTLIPTGLGTELFKSMFPNGELLTLG